MKRWFGPVAGPVAGLIAGGSLAVTPVAVLMFRYDNPDALLVLLMVAGAYATVRAVEVASRRWLAPAGVFLGFGFLTRMMQAFLVLPAFALVYLLQRPRPHPRWQRKWWRRRGGTSFGGSTGIGQLFGSSIARSHARVCGRPHAA